MTTATDERAALAESAEQLGWRRNAYDRTDVYLRGNHRVHVMWRGTAAVNGGAHYEDGVLMTHTRELAKIRTWLAK